MKLISKLYLRISMSIFIVLAGIVFTQVDLQAQEADKVKHELFREVEAAIEQARRGEVPVLAPTLFAKATQFYRQAEAEYQKGERISKIRKRIEEALKTIQQATDAARVSRVALAELLATRQQAAKSEHTRIAFKEFAEAERRYQEAISKAEAGDIRGAKKKADQAMRGYREMTTVALLKGPIKNAEERLKKARSTLSRQTLAKAERDLKTLKKSVRNAKKQKFNLAEYEAEVLAKIDAITSVIGAPAKSTTTVKRDRPKPTTKPSPKQDKIIASPSQESFENLNLAVYPNPFINTVTIEFVNITDSKPVIQQVFKALGLRGRPNFPDGIHSYTFSTEDYLKTEKMLLEKYEAKHNTILAKFLPLLCLHYLRQSSPRLNPGRFLMEGK